MISTDSTWSCELRISSATDIAYLSDSIDAIDMIVHLQKKTGNKIKPEEFKAVRTVQDVVDAVERLFKEG